MKSESEATSQYVVCIRNDGYPESLELRKLYRILPDREAGKVEYLRVIDESGDDYLYPRSFFAPVKLSDPVKRTLAAAADAHRTAWPIAWRLLILRTCANPHETGGARRRRQ